MKCQHCQAEWTVSQERSRSLTSCPFCGAALVSPPRAGFATMEEALREIASRFGLAALRDDRKLMALFSDLSPQLKRERLLLSYLVQGRGHIQLLDAWGKDEEEQRRCCLEVCRFLTEEQFVSKQAAETVCMEFARAIGFSICGGGGENPAAGAAGAPPVPAPAAETAEPPRESPAETAEPPRESPAKTAEPPRESPAKTAEPSRESPAETEEIVARGFGGGALCTLSRSGVLRIWKKKGREGVLDMFVLTPVKGFEDRQVPVRQVEIKEGITAIRANAFHFHGGDVQHVRLPGSLTSIGRSAFAGCGALRELVLPQGVADIGPKAFSGCAALERIELPASVLSIGEEVFSGCGQLASIVVAADNPRYCGAGSILYNAERTELICCAGAGGSGTLFVPEGVEVIGTRAFAGCVWEKIFLPSTLREIRPLGFDGLDVRVVAFRGPAPRLGKDCFRFLSAAVCYPEEDPTWTKEVRNSCGQENALIWRPVRWAELDGGLAGQTVILGQGRCGEDARWTLYGSGLLSIEGTGTMKRLEFPEGFFEEDPEEGNPLRQIVSIRIGEGITAIDTFTFFIFYGSVKEIHLPESLTSIGISAFAGCDSLEEITIPKYVTSIGSLAFRMCAGLRAIRVEKGNTCFAEGDGILYDAGKTTLLCCPAGWGERPLVLPGSVTAIASCALAGCRCTKLVLPRGLQTIGPRALYSCEKLEVVEIPAGVTEIGPENFGKWTRELRVDPANPVYQCIDGVLYHRPKRELAFFPHNLQMDRFSVPEFVVSIGESAFEGFGGLTAIVLGEGVREISQKAFYRCDALERIDIPSGVTSIGDEAFACCGFLTTVVFHGPAPQIGERAFEGVTAAVRYPAGDPSWERVRGEQYGGTLTWSAGR